MAAALKNGQRTKIAAKDSALGLWRRDLGDDARVTATLAPQGENRTGLGHNARVEPENRMDQNQKSTPNHEVLKSKNQTK
jgi:hypothetical protein